MCNVYLGYSNQPLACKQRQPGCLEISFHLLRGYLSNVAVMLLHHFDLWALYVLFLFTIVPMS